MRTTPGPWDFEIEDEATEPDDSYLVGRVLGPDTPPDDRLILAYVDIGGSSLEYDEQFANLALMAAAPELLAACQAAREHVVTEGSYKRGYNAPLYKMLTAAIDNAELRQP